MQCEWQENAHQTNGFRRIPTVPRRAWRGANLLGPLTPQGRWIHDRSRERARRNPDFAWFFEMALDVLKRGEIGSYESVRFIVSPVPVYQPVDASGDRSEHGKADEDPKK